MFVFSRSPLDQPCRCVCGKAETTVMPDSGNFYETQRENSLLVQNEDRHFGRFARTKRVDDETRRLRRNNDGPRTRFGAQSQIAEIVRSERIALKSINEPGSLAQITTTIAEHDGNIDSVSMNRPNQDFTDVTIDLTVWDLKHLSAIISELREKRVISRVERVVG